MKFNVGQRGYYRVKYPKSDWLGFSALLKDDHKVLGQCISIIKQYSRLFYHKK